MVQDMEDYGQFIEIDIIVDSNNKKNDDIIIPKYIILKKVNENPYINIFINGICFIIICMLFYNIYVSPPLK
uniref:Uncharacterized protein n=1 Tax=viral metagenome TaxID=1070528 RepID=A0A6C0DEC9_9ZZZZ